MSRSYEINIEVEGLEDDEDEKVKAAIESVEDIEVNTYGSTVFAAGDTTLAGGTTEDDRAQEIAKAIWAAVKAPVAITISWYFKDRDPDETNYFTEDEYDKMFPALEQLAMAAEEEKGED
jgi:hypothetical protein